jgi:hypothetical protein
MARSLNVTQEEVAGTSPLFTGFLVLSVTWLALSAIAGFPADAASDIDPGPSVAQPLD